MEICKGMRVILCPPSLSSLGAANNCRLPVTGTKRDAGNCGGYAIFMHLFRLAKALLPAFIDDFYGRQIDLEVLLNRASN